MEFSFTVIDFHVTNELFNLQKSSVVKKNDFFSKYCYRFFNYTVIYSTYHIYVSLNEG